jgi:cystathionine beta-lyase
MADETPAEPAASDFTRAIRAGGKTQPLVNTVSPPIQRASTVLMKSAAALYDHNEVSYGRAGLQPHGALCEALDALEGSVGTRLVPSGLAAMTAVLLAFLKAGDDILVVDSIYAPTRRFCDTVLARFGVTTRYYAPTLSADDLLALATPATRMIVLESPGSLTFEFQDVPAIAALARARGILTAIDNTWGAGVIYKPIAHGVDISVQALTKYVGGHSDVFMGSASVRDEGLHRTLTDAVWQVGWAVSPDDAYQMLRGIRTLPTRLARHGESAVAIARWLSGRPEVESVLCAAVPGAPGHELWARDCTGYNGLFSLVLKPGAPRAVDAFLDALSLFGLGYSWGGFESLAIPCDPQLKFRAAPPSFAGPLIRLHVGLEDPADLMADLERALAAYGRVA